MSRAGARIAVVASALTALTLGGGAFAVGADALPTSCTFTGQNGGKTASARCTGGTGQVRVYVKCYDSLRGSYVGEYDGPWVKVGATSRVTCPREGNVQTIIEGGGFDVR